MKIYIVTSDIHMTNITVMQYVSLNLSVIRVKIIIRMVDGVCVREATDSSWYFTMFICSLQHQSSHTTFWIYTSGYWKEVWYQNLAVNCYTVTSCCSTTWTHALAILKYKVLHYILLRQGAARNKHLVKTNENLLPFISK